MILYPSTEQKFDTNGLGLLSEALTATVRQEVKGVAELRLTYRTDGHRRGQIVPGAIITAEPDNGTALQPYRIYKVRKGMGDTLTVEARHLAYDLIGVPVSPYTAQKPEEAFAGIAANAATECPFTITTEITDGGSFELDTPASAWDVLKALQDRYGGEYIFDRYTIRHVAQRGGDSGLELRYGKNLLDFQQEENVSKVYTGIYPFWADDTAVVELPEKILAAPGTFDRVRILPVDLSQDFDEVPTVDQLRSAANAYIADNHVGVPQIEWKIEASDIPEGRMELGDTVTVYFSKIGVAGTARVAKTEYDPIRKHFIRIYVGDVAPTLASTLAGQKKATTELQRRAEGAMIFGDRTAWGARTGDPLSLSRQKNSAVRDGQLIVDPETGDMYHDVGGKRIKVGNGKAGPYYTPDVTQTDATHMQVVYTGSEPDIPPVQTVEILLPRGQKGDKGAYYTPSVTQTDATHMQVSYAGSEASLPAVPAVRITLPRGPKGDNGSATADRYTANLTENRAGITGPTFGTLVSAWKAGQTVDLKIFHENADLYSHAYMMDVAVDLRGRVKKLSFAHLGTSSTAVRVDMYSIDSTDAWTKKTTPAG